MDIPRWGDVREDWEYEPDHALRDIYVFSTTPDDWQRLTDAIRSNAWSLSYTEDGEAATMPSEIREVFERRQERATRWDIRLADEIGVRCHFFSPDEIEFDLDPREIVGQTELDKVCGFLQVVGRAVRKPVVVTFENAPSDVILGYDPLTDEIRRPQNK